MAADPNVQQVAFLLMDLYGPEAVAEATRRLHIATLAEQRAAQIEIWQQAIAEIERYRREHR